jgi:thymidine kinase
MAKLFFRYAAMNAGKSTALLQVAHNYGEGNMNVLLFTAAIDNRTGVGIIASRLGLKREAATFDDATDFGELVVSPDNIACILIDEAQFLSEEQVVQLHKLAHGKNVPVMCWGLRTDSNGRPFPGSVMLLALSDDMEETKTICSCGKKATMQIRLNENGERVHEGPQVAIGGNDRYRQVCAKCFYFPREQLN